MNQSTQCRISETDSTRHAQSRKENSTETVDMDHLLDETRAHVHELLAPTAEMCKGKLGEGTGTNHRVTLSKGSKAFNSQPYRAKPRARQAELESIDKLF